MTDEADPGSSKVDPIVHFGSIPGADGTAPESAGAAAEGHDHSGSAYDQVRGLLAEPGPPVGAGKFSDKMAEEMESFERRWSERPVSTLVSAGKKMADQSDSTGLNRLLGLSVPAPDPDSEPAVPGEMPDLDASSPATDEGGDADKDDEGDAEVVAPEVATEAEPESEAEIVPLSEDDTTQPHEHVAGELGPPAPESNEDQTMTATPTVRMLAAQTAYTALNPLEAEIFRSQMGLMDATQFRDASTRSQELALATIHRYEQETIDLQRQLDAARVEAAEAQQAAATLNEALAGKVAALEGRLELLTAELLAARSEGAGDGDDSEGGAGRELVKGHDDLRPEEEELPAEAADRIDDSDDDSGGGAESDYMDPEEAPASELFGDEATGDTEMQSEGGEDGDGGMAQMLQLLAQGEDTPVLEQDFGE